MPWIFDAPIQTSGAALKWFIEKFCAEEQAYCEEHDKNVYAYLNELALRAEPGSGGAKSRTWSMIKASMLKCPVYLLDEKSGDVPVGDVLIAGTKVGVFPSLTEAVNSIVKVKEIIQPNDEWAKVYDELYPYYVEMYKHLDQDSPAGHCEQNSRCQVRAHKQ